MLEQQAVLGPPSSLQSEDGRAIEKAAQGRGGLPEAGKIRKRMPKRYERREIPGFSDRGWEDGDAGGKQRSEQREGQPRVPV